MEIPKTSIHLINLLSEPLTFQIWKRIHIKIKKKQVDKLVTIFKELILRL